MEKNILSLNNIEYKKNKIISNSFALDLDLDENKYEFEQTNNTDILFKKTNKNEIQSLNFLTFYSLENFNLSKRFELDFLSNRIFKIWQLNNQEFILQCLNRHNYYRKNHGVCELSLNQNLIIYSKDWADILARNDRLERRFANRYGENVFFMQLDECKTFNGNIPTDYWYNKGINYNYSKIEPENSTAPFTQMVWKNTKWVGFAYSRSKTNKIYAVASYDLSGNFSRQYIENVLPPIK